MTGDRERFLEVEWSDEPVRAFEIALLVTVENGKGVLARVASALAAAEADITHVGMSEERVQHATDLRFAISVRDREHLAHILRALKRTPSVLKAQRIKHTKDRNAQCGTQMFGAMHTRVETLNQQCQCHAHQRAEHQS